MDTGRNKEEVTDKSVWQILVPCVRNDGRPFRVRFHRVWDNKVKEVSGGMTIHLPSKGKWISPEGLLYEERMIPVTFIATRVEAEKIADFTKNYYTQKAVLCYKISDEYILK